MRPPPKFLQAWLKEGSYYPGDTGDYADLNKTDDVAFRVRSERTAVAVDVIP